jgi:hypothetical protein
MNPLLIAPILEIGKGLIDKLFPDKSKQAAERAQAEFALAQLQQDGTLKELGIQMSAIIAEAQSADPWTSRARPSFLYVMYAMILTSVPMGILYAFKPEVATAVAAGVKAWLDAIPDEMWWLFGAGYLGYTGARMFEKRVGKS